MALTFFVVVIPVPESTLVLALEEECQFSYLVREADIEQAGVLNATKVHKVDSQGFVFSKGYREDGRRCYMSMFVKH